jgi:hypothetical protein
MVNKELLTYLIADSIIMVFFLMLNFETNPHNRNIEMTILYLGSSFIVMIIVSFILNRLYFKKQKTEFISLVVWKLLLNP